MDLTKQEWKQIKAIIKSARSVVTRWYREPPEAEGGDFLADIYQLKEAVKEFDESLIDRSDVC